MSDWFPNTCGLKPWSVCVPADWPALTPAGREVQKALSELTEEGALWPQLFLAVWYMYLCVSPHDNSLGDVLTPVWL